MKILLPLLLLLLIPFCVMAEPFSDVPVNHWSYDSVKLLQEKGLLEGYPDGLFKGDRPLSRYEMAMIVARVVARLQEIEASIPGTPDLSGYAAKTEIEEVNKLLKEYHNELQALGVRVNNIEDSLGKINDRIEEMEKVFVSGDIMVVSNALGFTNGPSEYEGTIPFVVEEYAAFGLSQGFDISTKLNLDIGVNINENLVAGGTFTAYHYFGDPLVTFYWGLLPQFNPQGTSQDVMLNNGLNFQANLNKMWFKTSGDWEINGTFGEYQPEKVSHLMYYGVVGPSNWSPDAVPVYGIDINGKLYENYKFEIFQASDLVWSGGGSAHVFTGDNPYDLYASDYYQHDPDKYGYHNRMYGALMGYENEKFDVDATYLRIYEDSASRTESTLPANNNPRDEVLFGLRGSYKLFEDKFKLGGEFVQSWYSHDLTLNRARTKGSAFIIGGEGAMDKFDYEAKFLRIDGNYEPFNLRKIFTNTDDGAYIMSYYTNNRTGFYGNIGYNLDGEKGRIDGGIAYFQQVEPTDEYDSDLGDITGFCDHYFHNNSTDKGKEFQYNFGGTYNFTNRFSVKGRFLSMNFSRNYADYKEDHTRRFIHLSCDYRLTDSLTVTGIYRLATVKGINDDGINDDFVLHIPGISLHYAISEDTVLGIDYRYYTHRSDDIKDYSLNRVTTHMSVKF